MRVEIINTGTELLLGNVTNTHLAFLGQELFPLGLRVDRQVCVPDGAAIRDTLLETVGRADVVLVTGGLGPTTDDITRDLIADLLGRPLAEDPRILTRLQAYFRRINRLFLPSIARQAQVPAGATVLDNAHGTAPGLYLPPTPLTDGSGRLSPHVFLLPGPPRELRPMFRDGVVPILRGFLPTAGELPQCRIYRAVGIGESQVEALVGPQLEALGLEVGYCARVGEVDLRLIGQSDELDRAEEIVFPALGGYLLEGDSKSLEETVVHLLRESGQNLAVAESCTGGLLAHRLTNVPGASVVFLAGMVTYSNQAKETLLGLDPSLLQRHGAVSAEVAAAMAAGARTITGTDFALATTGEAGPAASGEGKPVGTLFVALADGSGTAPTVEEHFFPTDREAFKQRAAQAALDLLRRKIQDSRTKIQTRSRTQDSSFKTGNTASTAMPAEIATPATGATPAT